MKKLVGFIVMGGSASLMAIQPVDRQETQGPTNKVLKNHNSSTEIVVLENVDQKVEEEINSSDDLKDPKKAAMYLAKAKEMMKQYEKFKKGGDQIEANGYKNKAVAYGVLSEGYKKGNQKLILKGTKMLESAKAQAGE